jgi:hypothetical protein
MKCPSSTSEHRARSSPANLVTRLRDAGLILDREITTALPVDREAIDPRDGRVAARASSAAGASARAGVGATSGGAPR